MEDRYLAKICLNSCSWTFCIAALQLYQEGQFPAPDPTVTLCFGEELQDISNAKNKLIIVQVDQVKGVSHK